MYRVLLLSLLSGALATVQLPGRCENDGLKYIPINDVTPFTGRTWYLLATLGSQWYGGDCPTMYSRSNPEHPKTEDLAERIFLKNGEKFQFSRPIKIENNHLRQNFNAFTLEESSIVDYYVLDSDIVNYGILYTCFQESPDTRLVSVQVYGTQKHLPAEAVAKIDATAQQYPELKKGPWIFHDHSKCSF